ncbi:MAG: serine/threonine-protein kinase, partial [Planctomycetota bacterium]
MKSDILFSPASPESDSLSADDTQPMQTPRFDHIGQFLVEEKIGEGGMGVVYRAHDPSLQRTVAIKRVHPRLKDHHDIRDKFLAEARAIAAVNHPNIGQIHAIHDEDDLPYLVMEFLPGPSFEEELNERGKLPIEEVLKVAISATRALEEARNQGIIHRDIKPSNLIVDALG